MNNAVYGKTMENLRNVSLANNNKNYLKWTAKPSFITRKIFDNNLVEIHKIKTTLTLNKPGYVGMCMLEISKSSSLWIPLWLYQKPIWQQIGVIIHRYWHLWQF